MPIESYLELPTLGNVWSIITGNFDGKRSRFPVETNIIVKLAQELVYKQIKCYIYTRIPIGRRDRRVDLFIPGSTYHYIVVRLSRDSEAISKAMYIEEIKKFLKSMYGISCKGVLLCASEKCISKSEEVISILGFHEISVGNIASTVERIKGGLNVSD